MNPEQTETILRDELGLPPHIAINILEIVEQIEQQEEHNQIIKAIQEADWAG